jgi:hypothetical protein
VNRATGEPVYWTEISYEIRFRNGEEKPSSWSMERDPPAEGVEPLEDPGAFDLEATPADPDIPREELAGAEFRVRARARGFAKASTDWLRWADFPRDRVVLVEMDAEAPSRLLARVRTGEGVPYRGRASLTLNGMDEFRGTDPVEADAEGVLVFEGLTPGTFQVSVSPQGPPDGSIVHYPGDGSGSKEILLQPGGMAEAEFVLARVGEIAVEVAAVDGTAVDAWVVEYRFKAGSGSGGESPRRITGCPPGECEVEVWAKGFMDWRTTVRVEAGATARVVARLERAPWSDFLQRVPEEVFAWLDRTAARLAKTGSLRAAAAELRRATKVEVWDHLALVSGFGDRGAEIRTKILQAWCNRDKSARKTTSYGSGTFLVVAPPAGAAKAEEAEEWWRDATADERKEWILSFCAENGGFVEVVRSSDDPCPTNHGVEVVRSVSWR